MKPKAKKIFTGVGPRIYTTGTPARATHSLSPRHSLSAQPSPHCSLLYAPSFPRRPPSAALSGTRRPPRAIPSAPSPPRHPRHVALSGTRHSPNASSPRRPSSPRRLLSAPPPLRAAPLDSLPSSPPRRLQSAARVGLRLKAELQRAHRPRLEGGLDDARDRTAAAASTGKAQKVICF